MIAVWRGRIALVALLLVLAPTSRAFAHALLVRSEPASGLAVTSPPRTVSLWFSEPVQVAYNGVSVLDDGGRRVDALDAHVSPAEANRVDVGLSALPQGSYVVRWQVTSGDNHVVSGTTWFAVGFAVSPPAISALVGSGAPSLAPWEILGRWLVYVAVLYLVGLPVFQWLVLDAGTELASRPSSIRAAYKRARRRAVALAGLLLLLGQLAWLVAQLEAVSGTGIAQGFSGPVVGSVVLGSRFALLWRLRTLLGLALAVILVREAARASTARRLVAIAVGVGVLATFSLASHAASVPDTAAVMVVADLVHLLAAAVWLGALVEVLLLFAVLGGDDQDARSQVLRGLVPRVSGVALGAVGVLTLTGLLSAWAEVQTLTALLVTPYGQTLAVKVALVALVLALAAFNLLVVRPRTQRGEISGSLVGGFSALVLAEVAIGVVVVVAAGLLASLPPPGRQPKAAATTATRQAGDVRVTLTADPNWVGVSRFDVALSDAAGRAADDVQSVTLTFTMQGMNMGRTSVVAARLPDGTYTATGYFVGMPGLSEVGVGIQRAGGRDTSAVFQIEVPDLTQRAFAGLRASAGMGAPGVFGAGLALVGALLMGLGWRLAAPRGTQRRLLVGASAALLVGAGLVLADGTLAPGAEAASNPVAATPEALARGRDVYAEHCQTCHGATGVGNGPSAAALLPPPSDLTVHARWHGDPQLFWFITHGVAGTAMPPFADALGEADRWSVVNYLHVLAQAPSATIQVSPVGPASPAVPSPAAGRVPSPSPAAAAPARSASPAALPAPELSGLRGRLVYGPDTDHDFWSMQLPDTQPRKLTSFGRLDFASSPAWSPDGRRIAYAFYQLPANSRIPLPPGTDLYVMNADGSGPQLVAAHDVQGAVLQTPAWAPDGTAIYVAYQAQRPDGSLDVGVDRVEVATGSRARVAAGATSPTVSFDGRSLAYVLQPGGGVRSSTLWRSALDGSSPLQLIGPDVFTRFAGLRFSPDGRRLVFAAVGNGRGYAPPAASAAPTLWQLVGRLFETPVALADGDLWDLWTLDLDTRALRRITAINEDLPVIAWSPDGRRVGFLGGGSAATAEAGVSVMDASGGAILHLTSQPGHRGFDWAP